MQIGSVLEFQCQQESCGVPLRFSVLDVSNNYKLTCDKCKMEYTFSQPLVRKLRKFERLCRSVRDAEEILSETNVAVDVQGHSAKIPFRLLMTRLNTVLNLDIGGKTVQIHFRLLPLGNH